MTRSQLQLRLMAYIADHNSGRAEQLVGPLVLLTGDGFANCLYTFTLTGGEAGSVTTTTLVLKVFSPDLRGREHAEREWRALAHLCVIDHLTPYAKLLELDGRYLGSPFIVMDYISGSSFWRLFEISDSTVQDRLTRSFAARLVTLHSVDPQLLEPAAVPIDPYGYIEQELELLRHDSEDSPYGMLTNIVRWLQERKHDVPCERMVILHRDYHPWNVLVDAPEHLWVIDWDWRIGDARFDVAWTCMLMQRSEFSTFGTAFREEYMRQSGQALELFSYFEVLATMRWLLNVLPAAKLDVVSESAMKTDFQSFLVDPVRRAVTFLQQRTGIAVQL